MNIISTRSDLDACKGTPDHAQFMSILKGSIYRLEKDDEAKCWRAVEDSSLIERFGFVLADFHDAEPPALPVYVAPPVELPDPKLVGVEFDGVMCSATRDDQNGLTSVLVVFQLEGQNFQPTRFGFANGNELTLTKANLMAFMQVWKPFRQSFFIPEK